MAATRRERAEVEAEAGANARLVAMLRAGGATFLDGPSGRVIQELAAAALRAHGKAWQARAARAAERLANPPDGLLSLLSD